MTLFVKELSYDNITSIVKQNQHILAITTHLLPFPWCQYQSGLRTSKA